jgi:hypothetical protein
MLTEVFNIALVVVASKDTTHVQVSDKVDSSGGMEKSNGKGKRTKEIVQSPFMDFSSGLSTLAHAGFC